MSDIKLALEAVLELMSHLQQEKDKSSQLDLQERIKRIARIELRKLNELESGQK